MNKVPQEEQKGYLLVLITGILWGSIGLFVKWMGQLGATPTFTSFCRMAFALPILVVLTLIKCGPKAFLIDKYYLRSCALMGFLCQALYNFLYSFAVDQLGVSVSSVLLYISPAFTSILSYFIFKEKISVQKWFALLANIAGCALTVTGGKFSGLQFSLSGLLFVLGAALCYAFSAIIGRFATARCNPYVASTYNFAFATLFLLIFTRPWQGMSGKISPLLLLVAFGFALIPTAITYLLYFTGLQKIKETSRVPVLASVETVSATLLGIFVLGEEIGLVNWLGICLVFISILLMNLKIGRSSAPQDEKN